MKSNNIYREEEEEEEEEEKERNDHHELPDILQRFVDIIQKCWRNSQTLKKTISDIYSFFMVQI